VLLKKSIGKYFFDLSFMENCFKVRFDVHVLVRELHLLVIINYLYF